jgi:tripartite-type tricarboxylate transporter receptor subunit TctC
MFKREFREDGTFHGRPDPRHPRENAMKILRREFLHLATGAAASLAAPRIATAQAYPARPVRILVGFAPGGGTDIMVRLVAQALAELLGQPFIVENRPGAGTNIATQAVINTPADGYTLLAACLPNASNAALYGNLKFNFLRDIVPIAGIASDPFFLEVHPSVPASTVPELIALAKANPGKITMASGGVGAANHIAGEMFKLMAGVDLVHVPYRGSGPGIVDLLAGQVQVMFNLVPTSFEYVRAGKLRALAVGSATRHAVAPDVPTLAEFLPGYEAGFWSGIGAPRDTPVEIVDRLNKAINAALDDPKLKTRLSAWGSAPLSGSPAEFSKFVTDETEKWGKVIRVANIQLE